MVDGPNLYAYAGSNPVSRVDPSGQNHLYKTECSKCVAPCCACLVFVCWDPVGEIYCSKCHGGTLALLACGPLYCTPGGKPCRGGGRPEACET